MNNYDVSIIIPVYNVEKYIEKCATTLFEQDYGSIEYVFVNDCTPDNSIKVLEETIKKYPNRKDDIKIINKLKNEGLGQARKTGLENSTGEYILHVDSDDWAELNMISLLVKKAKKANADIIIFDYFKNYQNKETKHNSLKQKFNKKNAFIDASIKGEIDGFIWTKFCKRTIYKNVDFPKFSFFEDVYITIQIFYYSEKIEYLEKKLLHYNQINENSITKKVFSDKNKKDLKEFVIKTKKFLLNNYPNNKNEENLRIRVLHPILASSCGKFKETINFIYPEANNIKYLIKNKKIPILKKAIYSLIFLKMEILYVAISNFYQKIMIKKNRF